MKCGGVCSLENVFIFGTANKELKSIIKQSKHYSVQGIICTTSKGYKIIQDGEKFVIPVVISDLQVDPCHQVSSNTSQCIPIRKGYTWISDNKKTH